MEHSKEQLAILRLIRSNGIGSKTFLKLINLYGSALEAVLQYKNWSLKSKKIVLATQESIDEELLCAEKLNAEYVFYNDKYYPLLLKHIDDHPIVLSYIGDLSILNQERTISIVGSRNASYAGKKFTSYIGKELALRNFVIVSGMARGIDSQAHESSIECSKKTVAVIGSGLKNSYPSVEFASQIINSGGLVISEYHINEAPRDINFPRRNRIIAGLSNNLLVIEAKTSSGSMITAEYAAQMGRTIFAVPGFPFDLNSSGVNKLIKNGAIMVRNINDITDELDGFVNLDHSQCLDQKTNRQFIDDKKISYNLDEVILKLLSRTVPVSIENLYSEISLDSKIDFTLFLATISKLEMKGLVMRDLNNELINY